MTPRDPARSSPLPTHQRDCETTASGLVELDHLALPPGEPAKLVAEHMIEAVWRGAGRSVAQQRGACCANASASQRCR